MRSLRYSYGLVAVFFLIIVYGFYTNYLNTIQVVKSDYEAKHRLVEDGAFNSIKYADSIGQIIEQDLNEKMNRYSQIMLEKYRQNPRIDEWDLAQMKQEFDSFEIYIIDSNQRIVKTTFIQDLGFDFKKFPSFSRLLETRLQGGAFVADRMDLSTNTGALMKYSYIPTPDQKYLFELSLNISERYPVMNNLDTFSVAGNLAARYPSVEKISIYKKSADGKGVLKISKEKPFYQAVEDPQKERLIDAALKSKQTQINSYTDPSAATFTQKFIPYVTYQKDRQFSWWNSYVIEIVYNDSLMLKEIKTQRSLFWRNIIMISLTYLAFVLIIVYLLQRSEHKAYHDHLTGLPNRKKFEEHIAKWIKNARKNGLKLAILFMDLNDFKHINDTLGHNVGDKLLREVSKKLTECVRKSDVISRLGGDEFIVLLPHIESYEVAEKIAAKIHDHFNSPLQIDGHEIYVKLSIGISLYPDHGNEPEVLMQQADIAMYNAKKEKLNYTLATASSQTLPN